MISEVRPALVLLALFTLLTGVAYPFAVTGVAQIAFPDRASGSLLRDRDGTTRGSRLIGQRFDEPEYFWGRPSATSAQPYDGASSAASNLGPSNPALRSAIEQRIAALRADDPGNGAPVPLDLVTASGSGLDPHISPAGARFQAGRVARARGLDEASVRAMVEAHVEGRDLGVLGEPRVNVLLLNLDLDRGPPKT